MPVLVTHPTYNGPAVTKGGTKVVLHHHGQRARWFAVKSGRPIGPEQRNVAPAIAYAIAHGWRL